MSKGFKEVKRDYPVTRYETVQIGYQNANDEVEIDLKDLVSEILLKIGINNYDIKELKLNLPLNKKNDSVSGNVLKLRVDKSKFVVKIPSIKILKNEIQKTDELKPVNWKLDKWVRLINKLFYKHYRISLLDLKKGKINRLISIKVKKLIDFIISLNGFKTNHQSVIDYLNWVFETKAKKINLTIPLICAENIIQEWVLDTMKEKTVSKRRKWDV